MKESFSAVTRADLAKELRDLTMTAEEDNARHDERERATEKLRERPRSEQATAARLRRR